MLSVAEIQRVLRWPVNFLLDNNLFSDAPKGFRIPSRTAHVHAKLTSYLSCTQCKSSVTMGSIVKPISQMTFD